MCRSDTFSYTMPAATTRRSTEPEVFTFDRIHEVHALSVAQQCARPAPAPRRRPVRVLYPSTGRRYLPRAETSPAKRWLLALCLVVLMQIYAEDDVAVTAATEQEVVMMMGASVDLGGCALPPFTSAEEKMKAATARAASSATCTRLDSWTQQQEQQQETCPCPESQRWSVNELDDAAAAAEAQVSARARARSGSGYVVALLYPVYHHHKLVGGEQ